MACEKLATELNAEHRSAKRSQVPDTTALLHAAGGICAMLLLADIEALTETGDNSGGIIALRDIAFLQSVPAAFALKTRLFVGIGEELIAPVHRNVAEYLAARFLAQEMQNGLSTGRVLSLMTAADGGTVSGLRGLNAWLSVLHPPSRRRLIEIDPLGAALYGDTRLFSVEHKMVLLKSLHALARQYAALQRQLHAMETFLADYGLVWVGDGDSDAENDAAGPATSTWNPDASVASDPARIDFDRVGSIQDRLANSQNGHAGLAASQQVN
jgi:hypothetical protein